jgi:hypothetical protein
MQRAQWCVRCPRAQQRASIGHSKGEATESLWGSHAGKNRKAVLGGNPVGQEVGVSERWQEQSRTIFPVPPEFSHGQHYANTTGPKGST